MKGISLFISTVVHVGGGLLLGFELTQPPQFSSAAPVPSLAVSLVQQQSAVPIPAVEPAPEPEPPKIERKVEEAPPIKKQPPKMTVKRVEQVVQPQSEPPKQIVTESQGSVANSVVVRAYPDYLRNPPPVYPTESRRRKEEGLVLLSVAISADGLPSEVTIKESSKYRLLDDSALKAVSTWKFKPATMGGLPVASQVDVPIRFNLKG